MESQANQLDLGRFVQRRQLAAYAQDMARASYAYGVDLRRARWFATSSLSQTAMRAIELRWYELFETLTPDELSYPDDPRALPLLAEISRIARLLQINTPGVRLLTDAARRSGAWGLVTPMGNVRGSEDWLVIDVEGLRAQPAPERAFLLGAGLGHIQSGHGPIFVSHFTSHRTGTSALVRRLIAPWARLCVFSADRAGLLAAGAFEPALMALGTSAAERVPWYPRFAPLNLRRLALEDFDRSRVVARIRTRQRLAAARAGGIEIVAVPGPASDSDDNDNDNDNDNASDERGQEGNGAPAEGSTADASQPDDAALGVPDDAWSLARCDARLTRRLGLL